MKSLKLILAVFVLIGAGNTLTTNFAKAQDYPAIASDCIPPAPQEPRWYYSYYPNNFIPDWGPFFRRHEYRYGPVLVCSAIATPRVIISSKY
jgi:hypothetical protein